MRSMGKPDEVRRLLLIKPSSLGDIVHALPTLAALKSLYPRAAVSWVVKRQWAGLVERAQGVDEVIAVAGGLRGWLSQVPRIRAARFDLVVDLQGLFRSGALAWLSGCSRRVGLASGREGSPWLYTERVPVPAGPLHAVDRYLLVAAALGAPRMESPVFRFRDRPEDEHAVEQLLRQQGVPRDRPWLAMNVSARWLTKRWPAAHFAEAADALMRDGLGPVVFIGGPAERPESEGVRAMMRTTAVDLTGQTAVGLLPTLLRQAAVLITNDSGPMHIAASVGTPVVALFGPTDPLRTGPYGHGHSILTHDVECRPCLSRQCRHSVFMACLSGIAPEQVVRAVRDRVKQHLAPTST